MLYKLVNIQINTHLWYVFGTYSLLSLCTDITAVNLARMRPQIFNYC